VGKLESLSLGEKGIVLWGTYFYSSLFYLDYCISVGEKEMSIRLALDV